VDEDVSCSSLSDLAQLEQVADSDQCFIRYLLHCVCFIARNPMMCEDVHNLCESSIVECCDVIKALASNAQSNLWVF